MEQTEQKHTPGPWTKFMDMHSGGGTKVRPYENIFIEAPADEARVIFYNRFDRNPERVTCTCCGEDYSISEFESLEAATEYLRGSWGRKPPSITLDEYLARPDVLVIRADDIKPDEREGEVPAEGYVWQG